MKPILAVFMLLMSLFKVNSLIAQIEIPLVNPSFEDIPRAGGSTFSLPIEGWTDCRQFPKHTPPDIHSADSKFWSVSKQPYNGATFLGLVVRPDGSNECVWQKLSEPLEKGKSYILSVFLCQAEKYLSGLSPEGELVGFNQPAIIRIFGSASDNYDSLLAETNPIDHSDWLEYTLELNPERTITHLIIEAYFEDIHNPGAGHVLVDHARLFMNDALPAGRQK